MPFPAKVVPQVNDGRWGPYDCWVASTRGLVAFASGGEVHLDYRTVRRRAGRYVDNPTDAQLEELGPGNISDIVTVLTHPDTVAQFKDAGYRPPKVRNLGKAKTATVFNYLLHGYQAAVAIWYPTLTARAPKASGQDFHDNHSVRWYGAYDKQGNPKVDNSAPFLSDQLDPLCDGRHPGTPLGPQRIHRSVMIAEAGDVEDHHSVPPGRKLGQGFVLACVVKPAQKRDGSGQDPEPDLRSLLATAQQKIDDLQDERADILAALDGATPIDAVRAILNGASNATAAKAATRIDENAKADPAADNEDKAADAAVDGNDDRTTDRAAPGRTVSARRPPSG